MTSVYNFYKGEIESDIEWVDCILKCVRGFNSVWTIGEGRYGERIVVGWWWGVQSVWNVVWRVCRALEWGLDSVWRVGIVLFTISIDLGRRGRECFEGE